MSSSNLLCFLFVLLLDFKLFTRITTQNSSMKATMGIIPKWFCPKTYHKVPSDTKIRSRASHQTATAHSSLHQSSEDCSETQTLKLSNLQRKICILIILYTKLAVLFVGTVFFVFIYVHLKMELHVGKDNGASVRKKDAHCLKEKDILQFDKIWSGVEHQLSEDGTSVCFENMDWVLQIATSIYTTQDDKMNYQEKEVEVYSDAQREKQTASTTGLPLARAFSRKPFAHLLLDVTAQYPPMESIGPLKWTKSGIENSHIRGMIVNASGGEIIIPQSGYYFIYSHVMYNSQSLGEVAHGYGPRRPVQSIFKNYRDNSIGGRTKLLESVADSRKPTSFVQGIFLLQNGDILTVCTAVDLLYGDIGRFSYFGAYLI